MNDDKLEYEVIHNIQQIWIALDANTSADKTRGLISSQACQNACSGTSAQELSLLSSMTMQVGESTTRKHI